MTPEQLEEIRNLYRTDRIEPQHVAALLNEVDRLRAMVPRLEWHIQRRSRWSGKALW